MLISHDIEGISFLAKFTKNCQFALAPVILPRGAKADQVNGVSAEYDPLLPHIKIFVFRELSYLFLYIITNNYQNIVLVG